MEKYKAIDIAKWFIYNLPKNTSTTSLKIQKLLYFAEAWTNVLLDRELFKERIQAWAHGPVVPIVHEELKKIVKNKDQNIIAEEIGELNFEIEEEIENILKNVVDSYGEFSGIVLEAMTHLDEPWIKARNGLSKEAQSKKIINKKEIKAFFKKKYQYE